MKNIDSDLIRGNIDTIILTTMLDGDKYGLDIIKEVEIRSNGTYELKQPTLYSCLKRLENQELISSYWLDSDIGGRRHYYKLTEKGKNSLLQKQEEWTKSKFIIDNLLSNHDYDEYRLVKKEDYEKIIEGKKFDFDSEDSKNNQPVEVSEPSDYDSLDNFDEFENDLFKNNEESEDEISPDDESDLDNNLNESEFEEDFDFNADDNDEIIDDAETDNYPDDSSFDSVETVDLDNYKLTEDDESVSDGLLNKRINYHDDSDDAEADYPNQKRFKIPSIYNKINIDTDESINENIDLDDSNETEETDESSTISFDDENNDSDYDDKINDSDEMLNKNESDESFDYEEFDNTDNDYTKSIYSEESIDEDSFEDEFEDEIDDSIDEDEIDDEFSLDNIELSDEDFEEITDEYTSLLEEEMNLGDIDENSETDDRVYIKNYNDSSFEEENDDDLDIPTNTLTNQTANELNILSKLRGQEDEEINEYYGDKNSYINHLNKNNNIEILKSDDLNVVQEDLLSESNYLSQSSIDKQINEFSDALKNLNSFGKEQIDASNTEPDENDVISEELDSEIEEELITNASHHEESKDIIDFKQETNTDDYLNELTELKNLNNNGYFNSLDSADYSSTKDEYSSISYDDSLNFENQDSLSFDEQVENYNNQYGYNNSVKQNEIDEPDYLDDSYNDEEDNLSASSFESFNDIISKNMNDYSSDSSSFIQTNEDFKSFTPRFTENNYKQKLNNLSAYSKSSQEPQQAVAEKVNNEEIMNKVKDIKTLKSEFASDGILIKEYKKSNGQAVDVDRNYLLSNKLNLIKSLILLFGYVFILSAVFIIMNSTSAQTIKDFSFKYFLIGFIPFIVYALYHTVIFVISPYKKVPAKLAPRIMIFISVIITIQLLLITYCLNLQMGFYSFSQSHYNHLLWVIPTFISFAPIISTLIHMALYYSRNFNV